MSYLAGLRNNDIDHWYTLRVSSWPIGARCRRVAILSMRAADAPDQAYGSVVAASKLFQYLLPPLQLSSMTTYFMIKNIFIYLWHISINVLFLGPPRGGSEKNGSGGYTVGRKNCDMTGRVLIGAAWPHPVEGVVGRFLWRLRLCHPCATASARNRSRWQKFQKLDNQSKFSKERFSRSKLCRLALVRPACCRIKRKSKAGGGCSSNFLTQSCVGSRPMEPRADALKAGQMKTQKKMQLNPCSCPAQGSHHRWAPAYNRGCDPEAGPGRRHQPRPRQAAPKGK